MIRSEITYTKEVFKSEELKTYLADYCHIFGYNIENILSMPFTVVTHDSKNPYKQMYIAN